MSYNGWKNYETWACYTWISNEEGSWNRWIEAARRCPAFQEKAGAADLVHSIAAELKEELIEEMPDIAPSMYSDLLTASLGEIDYYEVARALIEAAKE